MSAQEEISRLLDESDDGYDDLALSLRLDLATIILRGVDEKCWTQSQLADAMGSPPAFVSRLVHSDANCEISTIARACKALGIEVRIVRKIKPADDVATTVTEYQTTARNYGKEIFQTEPGVYRSKKAESDEGPPRGFESTYSTDLG